MQTALTAQQFNQQLQSEKNDQLKEALNRLTTDLKAEKVRTTYKAMRRTLLDGGWR